MEINDKKTELEETAGVISVADFLTDFEEDDKVDDTTNDLNYEIEKDRKNSKPDNLSLRKKAEEANLEEEEEETTETVDEEEVEDNSKSKDEDAIATTTDDEEEETDDTSKTEQSEFYKKTLRSLFGKSIEVFFTEDDEGNKTEVNLEDLILDESMFNDIVQWQLETIKEEASKDKISISGVSEFTKDLIEIDRNNGDISQLLKAKEAYSDPLDNLDMATEEGQIQAIYLRMAAAGQDEDTINRLISSYKSDGTLEEMALKAETQLREAVQAQVDAVKKASKDAANQRKLQLKEYRKEFKDSLSTFELNDNIKNKLTLLATKEDESGRFEMDRMYFKLREFPEKAAKLALYLYDEEEFEKQLTNKAVKETKLNTSKAIKFSTKEGSKTSIKEDKNHIPTDENKSMVDISSLNS